MGAHDPSIGIEAGKYYLFTTGGGQTPLGARMSTDRVHWKAGGTIFASVPAWITAALGTTPGNLWAPDVSFFHGKWHLYYAGSVFGTNNSVIGLATNATLDPASPAYAWIDEGEVLRTTKSNDYNAIDPNVTLDAAGVPWMAFGSFWSGIKMRRLDPATGKVDPADAKLYSIASRNGGAIEAPSIVAHGGWYYLFVSYDACCKGVDSTYRTMVGRSSAITGPYVDPQGKAMMAGSALQVLASSGRYIGPGGGTAYIDGSNDWFVHHYYDGQANGAPELQIRVLDWTADGWPSMGPPLWL